MEGKLECEQEQQDGQPSELDSHRNGIMEIDDTTILLIPPSGSFTFNAGPRPYRDSFFTFLFLGTLVTTYGLGLFLFTHADFNLDSKLWHSKFNRNTNQCDLVQFEEHVKPNSEYLGLMLLESGLLPKLLTQFCVFVITVPFGMFFLWSLHRYTREVILVATLLVPLLPLGFGLSMCYGKQGICTLFAFPLLGQMLFMVFPLAISGRIVYQLRKNWSSLSGSFESIVQVFKTATRALFQHFFVLILNPILFLGSMVLVIAPICIFIWCAFQNGKIVPNFDVLSDPSKGCDQAMGYPCCKDEAPQWLAAYVTLACVTLIWVTIATVQLEILIVSSIAAQWYSTPECRASTFGIIRRSLRNVLGPSFGTACHMGTMGTTLVVKLSRSGLVKKMASRFANGKRQAGMISILLHRCFSWTGEFSEGQSRFAFHFAAISGESFWVSSIRSQSLLRRNSLPTMGTDVALQTFAVLPGMLTTYAFLLAILVYEALDDFTNSHPVITLSYFNTIIMGLIHFSLAIIAVIDTLYICYAMEKDVGVISKPEVCHVYTLRCPPSQTENGSLQEDKV